MKRFMALIVAISAIFSFWGLSPAKADSMTWPQFYKKHEGHIRRGEPLPPLEGLTPQWVLFYQEWRHLFRHRVDNWYHRWLDSKVTIVSSPTIGQKPPVILEGPVADLIRSIFGATADAALTVANCESHLNPGEVNPYSGAAGVFQFVPSHWDGPDDIAFTDDDDWNPLDAQVNIEHAFSMSSGGTDWSAWSCKP